MTDIVGRVMYSLRTAVDHGPVQNRWAYFSHLLLQFCFTCNSNCKNFYGFVRSWIGISVVLECKRIPRYWQWSWILMRWQRITKHRSYPWEVLVCFVNIAFSCLLTETHHLLLFFGINQHMFNCLPVLEQHVNVSSLMRWVDLGIGYFLQLRCKLIMNFEFIDLVLVYKPTPKKSKQLLQA